MQNDYRIPRSINGFNPYIVNTTVYLMDGTPTNAVRLGFSPDELLKWTGFAEDWSPLYPLYADRKGTYTTTIKDQLRAIINKCLKLNHDNCLLDRIAVSPNAIIRDLETFNLKKGELQKETRTAPKTIIEEPVVASLQNIGGCWFSIKCRALRKVRAAIFEEADSVQYSYIIGDVPPTSADVAGLTKEISTRASFTLQLDPGSSGKHLYIFFRWYRTKYPSMSGPWNTIQMALIV